MSIELRWLAGVSVSSFHAAGAVLAGKTLVDPALAEAIAAPVAQLQTALGVAGERAGLLLEHLTALSGGVENNSQLAEVALTKTMGRGQVSPSAISTLASAIADLERAMMQARPGLVDELLVRGGPLRELWEARGPGLWHLLGKFTEQGLLVERADVLLVQPVLGGGGAAHWQYNSVRIEAVLANPHAELPEVARLAWLLSQLQLDLPAYSEGLPRQSWTQMGPLAMIPPVLAAAAEVELARADLPTTALAVRAWTGAPPELAQQQANALQTWWQTYRASQPRFGVALAALGEMI